MHHDKNLLIRIIIFVTIKTFQLCFNGPMVVCDNKLYLTPADKCVPIFVVPDLIPDHWGFVDV